MKPEIFALLLLVSGLAGGCRKEKSPIIAVGNGRWTVTEFSSNAQDIRAQFSGYVMEFEESGEAIARNGDRTFKGAWFSEKQGDQLTFKIYFPPEPLQQLNKDWQVTEQTGDYRMKMKYNNSGQMEYLTLQRN